MAEHVYKFEHKPHGLAVIIVNKCFKRQDIRYGAGKDLDNMQTLFKAFNFIVEVHKDLSADDMLEVLMKASEKSHAESDCFVCVISTHGEEVKCTHHGETTTQHVLYGSDDKFNYTSDFTKLFDNCPGLTGKPKLFFIQACRLSEGHTKNDLGHEVLVFNESKSSTDQSKVLEGIAAIDLDAFPTQESNEACKDQDVSDDAWHESQLPEEEEEREEETFCQGAAEDVIGKDDTSHEWLPPSSIACFKDKLIMWPVVSDVSDDAWQESQLPEEEEERKEETFCQEAAVSGLSAPRYCDTGSWMLTFLFEELMKIQPKEHLLHALTRVSYKMANEKSASKINVVSCISHRLCKEIYFTLNQRT